MVPVQLTQANTTTVGYAPPTRTDNHIYVNLSQIWLCGVGTVLLAVQGDTHAASPCHLFSLVLFSSYVNENPELQKEKEKKKLQTKNKKPRRVIHLPSQS
jgi:hypothetical protein